MTKTKSNKVRAVKACEKAFIKWHKSECNYVIKPKELEGYMSFYAWKHQQAKIDRLEAEVKYLESEIEQLEKRLH